MSVKGNEGWSPWAHECKKGEREAFNDTLILALQTQDPRYLLLEGGLVSLYLFSPRNFVLLAVSSTNNQASTGRVRSSTHHLSSSPDTPASPLPSHSSTYGKP